MSDNTIQLKVSVDTTELDKLEEQLTRISCLMQDVGVKPKSIPQFFSQYSGEFFIKDAFINSAEFKGVLVSNKLEPDTKTQLTNLRMQIDRQDAAISELKRVMATQQQAWSQAVNDLTNRTWCSQR